MKNVRGISRRARNLSFSKVSTGVYGLVRYQLIGRVLRHEVALRIPSLGSTRFVGKLTIADNRRVQASDSCRLHLKINWNRRRNADSKSDVTATSETLADPTSYRANYGRVDN